MILTFFVFPWFSCRIKPGHGKMLYQKCLLPDTNRCTEHFKFKINSANKTPFQIPVLTLQLNCCLLISISWKKAKNIEGFYQIFKKKFSLTQQFWLFDCGIVEYAIVFISWCLTKLDRLAFMNLALTLTVLTV